MNGFYVPGSISGSYVANKRNIEGTPQYEAISNEIAIQKQAALQNLEQNYSTTIENAYASYLTNQRSINTSAMGQGYKEAYKEAQEESLIRNIAEANKTAATARMQLESEAAEAQSGLQAQYEADVARLDRVASSLNDYLTYVRSLSGSEDASVKYFTEEQEKRLDEGALTVDDLYRELLGAQPKSFTDKEGQKGLSYREWIKSQMKDTEEDQAWFNWLVFQGGQEEFEAALSRQESLTLPQRLKEQEVKAQQTTIDKITKIKDKINSSKLLSTAMTDKDFETILNYGTSYLGIFSKDTSKEGINQTYDRLYEKLDSMSSNELIDFFNYLYNVSGNEHFNYVSKSLKKGKEYLDKFGYIDSNKMY